MHKFKVHQVKRIDQTKSPLDKQQKDYTQLHISRISSCHARDTYVFRKRNNEVYSV
jgi:hypothetical protein